MPHDATVGQGGDRSMSACSPTRPARIIVLDDRWCATTFRPRSRTPTCSREQGLLSAGGPRAIRDALAAIGDEHARGAMAHHARPGGLPDGDRESADGAHRRGRRTPACRPLAQRSSARRAAPVSARRGAEPARRRAGGGRGARRAGGARRLDRAAGLHPHAAGDAEHGGAVGARLRRRDPRRRRGLAARRSGARRRTRWAPRPATGRRTSSRIARRRARRLGFDGHARAGDRRAAVARQGRGAAAVRDHAAHAGPGAPRRGSAAVLHRRSSVS